MNTFLQITAKFQHTTKLVHKKLNKVDYNFYIFKKTPHLSKLSGVFSINPPHYS